MSVKLTPNRYAVVAGDKVELTVTLTPAVPDLAKEKISIQFEAVRGIIEQDEADPKKAVWKAVQAATKGKTESKLTTDSYSIKAKVLDDKEDLLAEDEIKISVMKDPSISIVKAEPSPITEGGEVVLIVSPSVDPKKLEELNIEITWDNAGKGVISPESLTEARWDTTGLRASVYPVKVHYKDQAGNAITNLKGVILEDEKTITVQPRPVPGDKTVPVTLQRSGTQPTADKVLWVAIRNRTKAMSFGSLSSVDEPKVTGSGYRHFIDSVFCKSEPESIPIPKTTSLERQYKELDSYAQGVGAYDLLKTATESFLLLECGIAINEYGAINEYSKYRGDKIFDSSEEAIRMYDSVTPNSTIPLEDLVQKLTAYLGQGKLPYINRIIKAVFPRQEEIDSAYCYGILGKRVSEPCLLELIWSYWHEEGMLVQTLNAISLRFQNKRSAHFRNPLKNLNIDPLRPLSNLLWGYIQEEQKRLTVARRAYEYDHHYGLILHGKAVPKLSSVDSRSKFLEAFHNLLNQCTIFFKEEDDTTIISDGFPLLNALKEVHLLLAQGAHNQFGDLPWTARVEMLIQQWLLGRPEMREFLGGRPMVPYKEDWMGQVDTMKKLQGWTDVSVTHFHDLAVFGEQLLLSIRYGDWIDVINQESAKHWAKYWRPEIQGYIHAYRATTGIDLTTEPVNATMPSLLLRKQVARQR